MDPDEEKEVEEEEEKGGEEEEEEEKKRPAIKKFSLLLPSLPHCVSNYFVRA